MARAKKQELSNDEELNEIFSNINTSPMRRALNEYISSLDSFFSTYTGLTRNTLIRIYGYYDPNSFSPDEVNFSAKSLKNANYDESSLRGENLILFPYPVIVSELSCTNASRDEKKGAIRLISNSETEKKFASEKIAERLTGLNNDLVTTYKIHEVVIGLILPKNATFYSVKVARFDKLNTEQDKLEKAMNALKRANEIPLIEIQKTANNFQRINSIIDIQQDKFESITSDIDVLEKERSHAEASLNSSQSTLSKVRNDIDKSSQEYDTLRVHIANESEKLEDIKAKITSENDLCKKGENRLNSLRSDTAKASEILQTINNELAEANRNKNLTTLDMVGHSNEASRQLTPYYILVTLTFLGLVWMAKYIYQNGDSFLDVTPLLVHISAWDILLSRLPLITATTLIITGLSGIFFFLIRQIVSLNTEKMTMLKAAILAEQITNSIECKNMTEQEKLEFKRDTKIKLITQVFSKNESEVDKTNFVMDVLKAINDKK